MKSRSLPAELTGLLDRIQHAGRSPLMLAAAEVASWPSELRRALVDQGFLEPAEPATSVICPGCEEACAMPVTLRTRQDGTSAIFITCAKRDDIGRVAVAPESLDQWRCSLTSLAKALAGLLVQRAAVPLSSGLRVGWVEGAAGRVEVQVHSDEAGTFVMVAGHRLMLSQVLGWDRSRIELNMGALRAFSGIPGGAAGEPKTDRGRRLLERKKALVGLGVRDFIKRIAREEGKSVTRVKQLLKEAESYEATPRRADPFAGLGATSRTMTITSSRPKKPKA